MATGTRERMIDAATELLRTRGLAATSFTDVLAASGAARGAIYHHFPGGKAELAHEAITAFGARIAQALSGLVEEGAPVTPGAAVDRFVTLVRPVVEDSTRGAGCAVAAVTLDGAAAGDRLLAAADVAFRSWTQALDGMLRATGVDDALAADLAMLMIVTLEGAHVLCRASGSIDPFDRAVAALRLAIPQG